MNINVNTTFENAQELPDLKTALACIDSPMLRQYCAEQLAASRTNADLDATLSLVMELASSLNRTLVN